MNVCQDDQETVRPTHRISDSAGWGRSVQEFCISNQSPGANDVAGTDPLRTTELENIPTNECSEADQEQGV